MREGTGGAGKGRYRIELPDNGNDDNSNGDFDVLDKTVIVGKGPGRTKVDGQDGHRVFAFLGFDARTLQNLTVMRGASSQIGGGIFIGPSDATIRNVVVRDSTTSAAGGGIFSVSPKLELDRVRVRDNQAGTRGGGVELGVSVADVTASIRNSTISGNTAINGAGLAIDENDATSFDNQMSATLTNSKIAGNVATGVGGGIASEASELTIKRSTISMNDAEEGAGIDLRPAFTNAPGARVTRISSSTIGPANSAGFKAGGILVDGNHFSGANTGGDPELHLTNSTVAENLADDDAGGIMGDNLATVDVENSSIGFNTANADNVGTGVAGGVYQHSNANFSVDDSIIAHNVLGQGGAIPTAPPPRSSAAPATRSAR